MSNHMQNKMLVKSFNKSKSENSISKLDRLALAVFWNLFSTEGSNSKYGGLAWRIKYFFQSKFKREIKVSSQSTMASQNLDVRTESIGFSVVNKTALLVASCIWMSFTSLVLLINLSRYLQSGTKVPYLLSTNSAMYTPLYVIIVGYIALLPFGFYLIRRVKDNFGIRSELNFLSVTGYLCFAFYFLFFFT